MPKTLDMGEYAIHRGCSRVAVWKAIKAGRITAEALDGGKSGYRIDPVIADAEWLQNTRIVDGIDKRIPASPPPTGRPRKEHAEARRIIRAAIDESNKSQKAAKEASKPGNFVVVPEVELVTERTKRPRPEQNGSEKKSGGGSKSGKPENATTEQVSPLSVGQRKMLADTRKAEAQAEKEEIELAEKKKLLAFVDDMEDRFAGMVAKARDSLLHLPKSFKVTFPGVDPEHVHWWEERITAVLSEMSKGDADV